MRRLGSLFLAAILTACGGAAAPSASPKPATFALKAATPTTSGDFLWTYVAKDGGIFLDNGIDADVQYIASTQALTALIAGQIDVSLGAGSDVLSAVAGGADLVVVAVPSPTYPFIFEIAPPMATANDLKGKKVGVASIGSSSDIATRVALKKLGLDPDNDVTIVAVGSAEARTAAALSGAIQGAVSLVPDNLVLEDKGWKPLVNLADLGLPAVQNAVTVTRAFLTAHRDVLQRFVDAMVIAIAREKKDKALSLASLKKWSKIDDARLAAATYDMYTKVHPALPYPKAELFADSKAQLGAKNAKVRDFDVARMLDDSFIKSAADRGLDRR